MSYKNQITSYSQQMRQGETPRQTEAAALLACASKIAEGQKTGYHELASAVRENQKLWTIFIAAVLEKNNPLPREIKNNILNLGVFVHKQSLKVIGSNDPSNADVLIRINRQIASGLSIQAEGAAAQAGTSPAPQSETGVFLHTRA